MIWSPKQGVATLPAFALLAALAASSCTDTVFVERELFIDPPVAALSFLGYSDVDEGLPVCGNCHVGKFADWRGTAHARAWDDLQESGHASESCEGCHSVSERGNFVEDPAGYTTTKEARYQDVQCESCHGPGFAHVSDPDASQPLAPLSVGVDLEFGCGECHSGAHNPFVEEWTLSRHGEAGSAFPRGREECGACHEGKGALEAFGINTEYLEKDDPTPLGITCSVCHDPHDPTNEKQLRFPVNVADVDRNLCMKCHQRRAVPDPTSSRGPHSPQGPLLLGEDVGWRPPNFEHNEATIRGTHGSERNERLCAGCHVNRLEVDDPVTGAFVFNATGHLFKPIPCLDEQGIPTADDDCALNTQERSFAACSVGGCHGDANAALAALLVARDRIDDLVEELDALLDQVPADQFSTTDNVFTTAEGAKFNLGLGQIESSAIHNPFLTEALLTASIAQVMEDYNLAPQRPVSLANVLGAGVARR